MHSKSTIYKVGVVVCVTTLHLSCSLVRGGLGNRELPWGVVAAIALCSGGYSESIRVGVRAEFATRNGALIAMSEVERRGADVFAFGESRGEHAVELYNTYVQCVNQERQRNLAQDAQGEVAILTVTRVYTSSPTEVAFDVIVRNGSTSPIAVTEARFEFNEHLAGTLASVLEVSDSYVVSVDESGALVDGPVGKQPAQAWYPSPNGNHMIVVAPLSQRVAAMEFDRFRLRFIGSGLRGPLERVTVSLSYDGDEVVRSEEIVLASMEQ